MSETSREEIAKLCDALPCGWKTQTCDASPKSPPCLKCRARRALLSQQRSLDYLRFILYGTALEAQPSPEPDTARKGKTP